VSEPLPATLRAPLADLARWQEATGVQAVIVGGVAASFLGRPRLTQDIDALAVVPERDWASALAAASDYGIEPRVDDPLGFAHRSRVLLLKHVASGIDIDIILGGLPFEQNTVEHGRVHDIGGVNVRLPRVEDLLIMKAVAHRPRDMEDIVGLLEAHPNADLEVVRQWVREFAAATAMSELIDDFDRLLTRHGPNPE